MPVIETLAETGVLGSPRACFAMKPTRYAIYQPLLKALAQALIGYRPKHCNEGELRLRPSGGTLALELVQPGAQEADPAIPAAVQAQSELLCQALQEDNIPWVLCRVGYFRKPVGWGVRVKITPSAGAPEVDLTPGQPASPPAPPAPAPQEPQAPAVAARPGPPSLLVCTRCHAQALEKIDHVDGIDYFRCQRCGDEISMHAMPSFEDSDLMVTRPEPRIGSEAGAPTLLRDPDGRIRGPGFSVHVRSPETLVYQTDSGTVPVHISTDLERGSKLEVNRVTTMDTAFGSRMLTPREHQVIVQNLQSVLSLLPGPFFLE